MVLYLNPFAWGMRKMPTYQPSIKTEKLIDALNKKHNLEMNVGDVIDSLWYFRDLENKKITELEDFELYVSSNDTIIKKENLEKYTSEFIKTFEHKKYFDSLKVRTNSDTLVYKIKIK